MNLDISSNSKPQVPPTPFQYQFRVNRSDAPSFYFSSELITQVPVIIHKYSSYNLHVHTLQCCQIRLTLNLELYPAKRTQITLQKFSYTVNPIKKTTDATTLSTNQTTLDFNILQQEITIKRKISDKKLQKLLKFVQFFTSFIH